MPTLTKSASDSLAAAVARPRIVIVGLNFGRYILQEFADGEAGQWLELAGVCDLDTAKAAEIADLHHTQVWNSLDEVLASDEIDAVGLFTGPVKRAALLDRIISAGKHCMTTKPMEADPEAALAVLRKAQSLGLAIHMNSPSAVLPPDLEQINRWREEFDLGAPVGARADVWASYREKPDGTWYDSEELCPAAPLFRLGIYLINDLVRLFGPARRVQVMQTRLFTERPTADNAIMGIEFENGALANLFASFCVEDGDHYRNSAVINFERGTVHRNDGPVRDPNESCELACVALRGEERTILATATVDGRSGTYDWKSFSEAILGQNSGREASPEEVVAGLRVVKAMAEAARTGAAVEIVTQG